MSRPAASSNRRDLLRRHGRPLLGHVADIAVVHVQQREGLAGLAVDIDNLRRDALGVEALTKVRASVATSEGKHADIGAQQAGHVCGVNPGATGPHGEALGAQRLTAPEVYGGHAIERRVRVDDHDHGENSRQR